MLEIFIDFKKVVLSEDTELTISLKSALIDSEYYDASYPLTVPLSPNWHIFGNIEHATYNITTTNLPAYVRFAGVCVFRGVVKIISITEDDVELCLTVSDSFMNTYAGMYLDELGDILGSYTWTPSGAYPLLELAKQSYFENSGLPFVFAEIKNNAVSKNGLKLINRFNPVSGTLNLSTIQNTIPFLFLNTLLELLFTRAGLTVSQNDMLSIAGFDKIYLIHIGDVFGEAGYVNGYSNMYYNTGSLPYVKMLPHVSVGDFLDEISRKFNIRFVFDDAAKSVDIRCANNIYSDDVMAPIVIDGITKTLRDMDLPNNTKYYDADAERESGTDGYDATLASITDRLLYNTNASVQEDSETETIECISRPTNMESLLEIHPLTNADNSEYLANCFNVPEFHIPIVNTTLLTGREIVFALFNKLTTDKYNTNEWSATPPLSEWPTYQNTTELFIPPSSLFCDSEFCLYWNYNNMGLYISLHKQYNEKIKSNNLEYEYYIKPDIDLLRGLSALFTKNIVAHARKYCASEQEISLTNKKILSWKILAVPI